MVFIYNRTEQSVYNYTDLNRVESAIAVITNRFTHVESEYRLNEYVPRVWSANEYLRQGDVDRIRTGIMQLKRIYKNIPDVNWIDLEIGKKKINVTEWNSWEWDLSNIIGFINAMFENIALFRQAGSITMQSGGVF